MNSKVKIFTYVTERTFDSYSYQILENKQRFISQIDRGDLTVREAEDIDEATLSYAEIKAITSANPKIKRKMELDAELQKLRVLEAQHRKNQYSLQDRIRKDYPEQIQRQKLYLERLGKDIETVKEKYKKEPFEISVNGVTYTDKKEGGQALMDALNGTRPDTVVAEYGGLKISLEPQLFTEVDRSMTLTGDGQYSVKIGESSLGLITRLDNFMDSLEERKRRAEEKLQSLEKDLGITKEQVNLPFEHAEKIKEIVAELSELNAELDLNRRDEVVIAEEGENEDTNEENAVVNPEKPTPYAVKRRQTPKTGLYEQTVKLSKTAQDSIVFGFNNGYYEAYNDNAKWLQDQYGCESKFVEIDGEKVQCVSLDFDGLDKIARDILNDGKKIQVVEETADREVKYIEKTNEKVVLPDYRFDPEDVVMSSYPLTSRRAKTLFNLGLEVQSVSGNKREIVGSESEIDGSKNHEINGANWREFCESDEGKVYLATRLDLADAASEVLNKDMGYFDAMYTDPAIDELFDERTALRSFLEGSNPNLERIWKRNLRQQSTSRLWKTQMPMTTSLEKPKQMPTKRANTAKSGLQ